MIWDNSCTKVSIQGTDPRVLHRPSYLKCRSNHSLTCHDSRQNSNDQTGVECAWRHRAEERVGVGTCVLADICSLTDVLDKVQRSEDKHLT